MDTKPKAGSAKKPATKKAKKEKLQRQRFIEAAREVGVDETGREFEQLFDRTVTGKT
jgi:hypothetical protein